MLSERGRFTGLRSYDDDDDDDDVDDDDNNDDNVAAPKMMKRRTEPSPLARRTRLCQKIFTVTYNEDDDNDDDILFPNLTFSQSPY